MPSSHQTRVDRWIGGGGGGVSEVLHLHVAFCRVRWCTCIGRTMTNVEHMIFEEYLPVRCILEAVQEYSRLPALCWPNEGGVAVVVAGGAWLEGDVFSNSER
jgi:hypothetical protein